MIYKTLRTLPMVICVEIMETGDVSLLADEPTDIDLAELWNELESKLPTEKDSKVFDVSKEVTFLENKYVFINSACEALLFDRHAILIENLKEYGYKLTEDNYHNDLDRISKQSEGILIKVNQLKDSLPKIDPSKEKASIIDVMANYMAIIGDFDFYSCSVEKFYSLEKAVKAKIEAMNKTESIKK